MVVDCGSALTFTAGDKQGRLGGGAILPGVRLQLVALGTRTAQLPSDVVLPEELPPRQGLRRRLPNQCYIFADKNAWIFSCLDAPSVLSALIATVVCAHGTALMIFDDLDGPCAVVCAPVQGADVGKMSSPFRLCRRVRCQMGDEHIGCHPGRRYVDHRCRYPKFYQGPLEY